MTKEEGWPSQNVTVGRHRDKSRFTRESSVGGRMSERKFTEEQGGLSHSLREITSTVCFYFYSLLITQRKKVIFTGLDNP